MAKGYWVSLYRSISNPDAVAAYAKLAGPALAAAGGKFLARGVAAAAYEAGIKERLVVIEFPSVAAAIAAVTPDGARVLEVGCGPGHLSTRLAHHGFDVTGLDLDPAMIARARANTDRAGNRGGRHPLFLVGDVAALAFPDRSFDLVVSTLAMHHWADPTAGLAEIGRVLRPGARALIWDFRPGVRPYLFGPHHLHIPDPVDHTRGSRLRVVNATLWPWPWRLQLTQRIELARADRSPVLDPP